MSNNPGTVNLSDSSSRGVRAVQTPAPDPVFGASRPDGSLGNLAHYKILKQLGCGGMGAVYLAQDEGLERRVALKVMLPSAAADPLSKERFLREARASAAVKHDNVVTIYQVGEDRSIPYIAMEYLAGSPLDQFLARKGRLSIQQALRVGIEAAEGLAAAHTLGLIHRDIKPANIWLEAPKGRIKILDFGIARRVADGPNLGLTGAGTVVGTPGYMSPEQARGKQLDARSDLFSLGVVLYQLTTGQVPFDGDNVLAILTALAVDDPVPVRVLNPETPPEFESLIQRLLAKKPDNRPLSALAVAEELRAISHGPVPLASAVEQAVPHVIYVPIAVTVQESFNPSEFDGLGNDSTEAIAEREMLLPTPDSGRGMWIAAGVGLLIAAIVVAVVAIALKKPTPPEPTPEPTPTSTPKKSTTPYTTTNPNPTPTPKLDPPSPGRGLRFAPEQSLVVPGLIIPDEVPYTLEGFVILDESFQISSPVFGTKYRLWAVIAKTNQGFQWDGFAKVKDANPEGLEIRIVGTAATKGRRTHVALVRSTKDVRLFIDGKLSDTQPISGTYFGGGLVSLGGERFAGIIEEFRASRAARYDKNFTPARLENDTDTDVLYRFDEGQGDTAKDQSGNGRNGKVNGPKWVPVANDPIIRVPVRLSPEEVSRILITHVMGHLRGDSISEVEMNLLRKVSFDICSFDVIDDKGMEKLSQLPLAHLTRGLEILRLSNPPLLNVTDEGLTHIGNFTGLQILKLPRSQVTDAGLKSLASLPKLKVIMLPGTRITNKAAAAFNEVRTLHTLDVCNTKFGDEGLKALGKLPELTDLRLEGTPVTDAGLESLHDRKGLRILAVKGTQVTAEGIKRLEEAVPGIKVQSDVKP